MVRETLAVIEQPRQRRGSSGMAWEQQGSESDKAIGTGVWFLGALTSLVVSAAACAQGPSAKFRAQVQ